MPIDFNALPDNAPSSNLVLEPGTYCAVIADAVMKTPNTGKADYLNLSLDIYDINKTKKLGHVFDKLFESEKDLLQFKLRCFCVAIGFTPNGAFELKDLTKICKNKEVQVTLKKGKDQNDNDMTEVNIFSNPYAPMPASAGFVNVPEQSSELPFKEPERTAEPAVNSAEDY